MSNQKAGQTRFSLQAPSVATYRVGTGLLYTTIQSAIDQAVADGFNTASTPAIVEIAAGSYTENLTLKPGVSLQAVSPGFVTVTGNHTYPVSNGLTRAQNTISLTNIILTVLNGITLEVSGTAPVQLTLSSSQVVKQAGGDSTAAFNFTNTGSGSRVRFQNGSFVDYNVAAGTAMTLARGATEFRDRNTGLFSSTGVTIGTGVALTNAASLRVWGCDNWATGNFTNIIDIQSTTATVDLLHTLIQNNLAGGNGILFTAAGTARVRWCFVSMNASLTGYIAKGAAGTFGYSYMVIIGANAQVQNTLTTFVDNGTISLVAQAKG